MHDDAHSSGYDETRDPRGERNISITASKTLNEHVKQNSWTYLTAIFTMGLFNNNGYTMVAGGAENLAKDFSKENLMPLFQLNLIVFNGLARLANAKWFIKTQHTTRQIVVTVVMTLGFLLISFSAYGMSPDVEPEPSQAYKFYLSLVASVMIGMTCALGESNNLGLLKAFPGATVGYWSSGTGFAGPFATLLIILLKAAGLQDWLIYLIAAPTMIPYIICCLWVIRQSKKYVYIPEDRTEAEMGSIKYSDVKAAENEQNRRVGVLDDDSALVDSRDVTQQSELAQIADGEGVSDNTELSCESLKRVLSRVGGLMCNLSLVYFFEYSITTSFSQATAQKIIQKYPERKDDFVLAQAFVILNLCYQIGVFISRSSLQCYRVEKVWVVTTLQLINFFLWFSNSLFLFCESIYVLFVMMVFVGLMGGTSYVNVIYLLKNSTKLEQTDKELSMMILTVFDDIGILSASILSLVFSLTIFKT